MIAALVSLGGLALWSTLATGRLIATDSYGRIPTRGELVRR